MSDYLKTVEEASTFDPDRATKADLFRGRQLFVGLNRSQPSCSPRSPAAPPRNPSSTAPAPEGVGSTSWLYRSANEPTMSGPSSGGAGSVNARTGSSATRVTRLMRLSGTLATRGHVGMRLQ